MDEKCVKDCIVNICMKASTKATPTKCTNPCQAICDPFGNKRFIVPRGGQNPCELQSGLGTRIMISDQLKSLSSWEI
ncbi:unnamed protein product [Eruca vesicaria subsp. sativa]|uniref:Uncharacterized protein n=1 Tax=Eruca vesicaria subsp. sativa TaxID=29727 RepID=A0ABC8KK32_ERUVS|nr:unnamed protein product [Eruca vesicaria subsp. sativa]